MIKWWKSLSDSLEARVRPAADDCNHLNMNETVTASVQTLSHCQHQPSQLKQGKSTITLKHYFLRKSCCRFTFEKLCLCVSFSQALSRIIELYRAIPSTTEFQEALTSYTLLCQALYIITNLYQALQIIT